MLVDLAMNTVTFTIPRSIPTGQYLVRMEAIALHSASTVGGGRRFLKFNRIRL